MNIYKVRKSKKSMKMEVLIDELSGDIDLPRPVAAIRLERGLKELDRKAFSFDGDTVRFVEKDLEDGTISIGAYGFLRDYLGIGILPAFMPSAMESKYSNLCLCINRPIYCEDLDKITSFLLDYLHDFILNDKDIN